MGASTCFKKKGYLTVAQNGKTRTFFQTSNMLSNMRQMDVLSFTDLKTHGTTVFLRIYYARSKSELSDYAFFALLYFDICSTTAHFYYAKCAVKVVETICLRSKCVGRL